MRSMMFVFVLLSAAAAADSRDPVPPGEHAAVRAIADVMREPALIEVDGVLRGWLLERSNDFGVVLIEVLGTIPLHMHPDGNRRMFVVDGLVRMRGGEHEREMKAGDYMYLPRDHHHKVWLAPGSARALLMLVDNPPTSTKNVVWLDPAPRIDWNPAQAASALVIGDRCESPRAANVRPDRATLSPGS